MFHSLQRAQFPCLRLGLIALFVAMSAAAQAQTKITAGMVAHGPPQWPQYISDELGWNKEAGIELDYITVGSGGAQQLAGGSLNIAHSGYPDFARAALQGATERIIINDIVASLDVEAIVARVDLGGVIRESTANLTMETVDAVRSQGISLDQWTSRVVDKVLFRKQPRNVELEHGSEQP